jgi:uncharacterized membrane protein YidH (DUF202 family)
MSHATSRADDASERSEGRGVRRAGAFDIRTFIGSLIGIYGVVLVIVGLVGTSDKQLAKSDNLNINLLAGIGMLVVAVFFLVWARLRPVVIPPHPEEAD